MALSTSITVVTRAGLSSHHHYRVRDLDSVGVATFSNFKTGLSNLHSIGFDVVDSITGTGVTVRSTGNAVFSGVITATKFVGDISEATGAAAGLGTALSQTQTDPLNKVYFTDKVLSISTTTTIDHPATANLAYTQYGDIKIEDGHDLIIRDGDDFKYDILGISTTKVADNYFQNGLTIGFGSSVKGNLIGDVTGNVTGNVTGSGENLTNIPAGQLTGALPAISGANLTGIVHGITEVDQWHLPSDWSTSGAYINTWQRFTQANVSAASPLGTGMSHSSGVFTFPSTGKYLVMLNAHYLLVQNDNVVVQIRVTINNNDYYTYATAKDGNSASNSIAAGSSAIAFVDVTNTSNVKVQIFATSIASGSNVNGYNSSDGVQTSVTFVRLGDT
jgi:hypothetical protein